VFQDQQTHVPERGRGKEGERDVGKRGRKRKKWVFT
jgi:hypothetical protein